MHIAVIHDPEIPSRTAAIEDAVRAAGGTLGDHANADALVWLPVGKSERLRQIISANENLRWVQLPWAGVDAFDTDILANRSLTFTCAKGAYQGEVSAHALLLTLACLRKLGPAIRNQSWMPQEPIQLNGKRVTIIGGGGLTTEYLRLLKPFACETRVLRQKDEPHPDATSTHTIDQLHKVLPDTDVLVLTLALTTESRGIIGKKELELLPSHAVLVNVARGPHINTDALVSALTNGTIAAAGIDVTDPEPLPDGHPLWGLDNAIITSHSANSTLFTTQQLAKRVEDNVSAFLRNQPLIGVVDTQLGY